MNLSAEQLAEQKSSEQRNSISSSASEGPHSPTLFPASPMKRQISTGSGNTRPQRATDFLFGPVLGEGSYARVVYARLKSNNKEYAIKIMEKRHIKKHNKAKYVMMERNILTELNHPRIVKLSSTFQDADYLYMVMDLAHAGEFSNVIRQMRTEKEKLGLIDYACDENIAQFYAAEVVSALEYIHSADIIHRDLKPENILMCLDGHIKLTDFGTALKLTIESERNSFVGTAEYVSPEVLSNREATKACDLWALGCLIFQMLTGRSLFHCANEYLTFQQINNYCNGSAPIEFPLSISSSAKDIILKLLEPIPELRLGAGTEGETNDWENLKRHQFFRAINWENLLDETPPYIPNVREFPSAEQMSDGGSDNWIFDGEATVIQLEPMTLQVPEQVPINRSKSTEYMYSVWSNYCDKDEMIMYTSLVYKRRGLFPRQRQLILTNRPRLIYFDPETKVKKGEIPWDSNCPVRVEIKGQYTFDVVATKTGRAYHLNDPINGSLPWHKAIDAELQKKTKT